jgi:ribosomal protein S18 acetylase RimI-like enzyme
VTANVPPDFGPNHLSALSAPSEIEINQIMDLRQLCESRSGIRIPLIRTFFSSLERGGVGAFQLTKDEHIIGFAFFYSFELAEAEAMIFVDPDEDWSEAFYELLNATKAECERRGHARLLLLNDQRFSAGAELLTGLGGKLAFSEHRMTLTDDRAMPCQRVDLREVGDDDATLRSVEFACFGRFYPKPDQRRFIASFEGKPIGKIDMNMDGAMAELTGFCVIPEFRRKGLGRSILMEIVNIPELKEKMRIELDVQTDNDNALSLYQKSGFRKESTMDYYELALERKA